LDVYEKRLLPCQNQIQCDGENYSPPQRYIFVFVHVIYGSMMEE